MIYLAILSVAAVMAIIALVVLLFILGSRAAAETHPLPDPENASENGERSGGPVERMKR